MPGKLCLSLKRELGFIFHPFENNVKEDCKLDSSEEFIRGAFAVRGEGLFVRANRLRWLGEQVASIRGAGSVLGVLFVLPSTHPQKGPTGRKR